MLDLFRSRDRAQAAQPEHPFDRNRALLRLSKHDVFTITDATRHVQILGGTGSGKTSSSGRTFAMNYLLAGFGGLVLCAKPEERQRWENYARLAGRGDDLIVFSPDQPWRFNFLDYALHTEGGHTENIVELFAQISETTEGTSATDSNDPYWGRSALQLVRNAVAVLRHAQDHVSLKDIKRLIVSAPQSTEEAGSGEWRKNSFCWESLEAADAHAKTPQEQEDFEIASAFWMEEFAAQSTRTRSGIVSHFTGIADPMLHGVARELFSTATNITPEASFDGKLIVLDMPLLVHHKAGRLVQMLFKYMWQRAVLSRPMTPHSRPQMLWIDESQHFISKFDWEFLSTGRSQGACAVFMTQNVSQYYARLSSNRDAASSLLANFGTLLFHSNGDHNTNEFASNTISNEWRNMRNYTSHNSEHGSTTSGGGSESAQPRLLPGDFVSLATPASGMAEVIIFQTGRVWKHTNTTYLRAYFEPRFMG